mgnify:FL=1
MEQQILELIEDEVNRRVGLKMTTSLGVIAQKYDIPIEQLVKDTAEITTQFCKGILKSKKRCLKTPQPNGYCKFHQCQIPPEPPKILPKVKAPWET